MKLKWITYLAQLSPTSKSVLLHVVVLATLFLGDFTSDIPKPTPMQSMPMQPIKAVAVERKTIEAQINKIKEEKAAQERKEREKVEAVKREKARKLRIEKEKKRKAEAEKARKIAAEKARKKKLAEQKAAEKKAAEEKARREKEAKRKKELEQKQAAERKRKELEAKERAEQQRLLEQQMAEEMASRQRARRQQMMTEIGRYTALITQTIQRNLITDKATMEGKSCRLTISLAPSGFVTNVVIGQGNRVVCNAAKAAVYKAGTLPVSKDPEVFKEMRTISLTVVPEF